MHYNAEDTATLYYIEAHRKAEEQKATESPQIGRAHV